MSTHYLMARAIHKEPGAEIKETLPRLYDKLQRSFGAILSACGSWSYQALEKNFGSCAFRGDDPLSNHFYFCLTDALNKHAKLIDTQVKTKFSR